MVGRGQDVRLNPSSRLKAGTTNRSLFRPLAERFAEGLRGVDADDAEFAREEFQLLQRKGKALVIWMAVDIGVKLRRRKLAVDHVAFQLRHVDAVGGKAAQRLVE